MAELKYDPVKHDHMAFLDKASKRRGFREAYDALEVEYALAHENDQSTNMVDIGRKLVGHSLLRRLL